MPPLMLSLSKDGAELSPIQIVQTNPMLVQNISIARHPRPPSRSAAAIFTILALLMQSMGIIAPFVAQIAFSTS
jgi:hypothetical protein